MIRVISLGAGVQSTTLALLAAHGEIGPMPDCAIFADTGEESEATYRHLEWLTACELRTHPETGRLVAVPGSWRGRLPYVTHIVAAWMGYGKPSIKAPLGAEILNAARGIAKPGANGTARGMHSRPPFFVATPDGGRGIIRRQCTGDYKIDVIQAKERELIGLKKRQRWPQEVRIEQYIGISTDEATRAKPVMQRRKVGGATVLVPHPTIRARFPLLFDVPLSRDACARWLRKHGYPVPPKSACVFCPFHSDAEWRRVRDDPYDWRRAVEIDEAIRHGLTTKGLDGALYLHSSLKPLREVDLSTAEERGQINLFENECEGMCGV